MPSSSVYLQRYPRMPLSWYFVAKASYGSLLFETSVQSLPIVCKQSLETMYCLTNTADKPRQLCPVSAMQALCCTVLAEIHMNEPPSLLEFLRNNMKYPFPSGSQLEFLNPHLHHLSPTTSPSPKGWERSRIYPESKKVICAVQCMPYHNSSGGTWDWIVTFGGFLSILQPN